MNSCFTACLLGAFTALIGCSGQKSPTNAATAGAAAVGGAGGSSGGGDAGGSTAAGAAAVGGAGGSSGGGDAGGSTAANSTGGSTLPAHWVGSWTASPYPVPSGNMPPAPLSNSVLRQVVHVSLGGSQLRVLFSNLSGNGPVTINSAHLAVCNATPAVDSTIDTTTDKALAFSGTASVTIVQGTEIWSDPIDFTIAPLGNISITVAFGDVPTALTGHAGARTTSYEQTGSSDVSAANMATAQTVDSWYYISGIDVMADASAKAIVAIGDSITDGRGTDTNHNNRWTDDLSARLHANAATSNVAIMNQAIGATALVGTTGTAAQARFGRDVLGQSGVRYVIVFDGVNDIGAGATLATMQPALDSMISQAHDQGLLIYGATITPFGGYAAYYTAAHETVRQQVNTYIKSGVFDGYLDFDAAVTDNGNPPSLQAIYDTWAQTDGLHLNPAGYQKLADSVDLNLFTK